MNSPSSIVVQPPGDPSGPANFPDQPDILKLQAVLTKIRDDPEHHVQTVFIEEDPECGTVACFAGWACLLFAHEYGYRRHNHGWSEGKGSFYDTDSMAANILGIQRSTAQKMFAMFNTLPMLEEMVKDLANDGRLKDWEHYRREQEQNS